VCAYLHIPALVQCGGYREYLFKEKHEGLLLTSLQGNPEDLIGDLLVLRNRWTTGVTEETILSSVRNTALKITAEEQSLRTRIASDRDDSIIDRICRAIGTLRHSFTIDTSEALRALSLVKFGVELGWIKGMTLESVNQLFFDCRRAHLAKNTDVALYASPGLYKTRALVLRAAMSSVEFV
jgi:protein arginine kinase